MASGGAAAIGGVAALLKGLSEGHQHKVEQERDKANKTLTLAQQNVIDAQDAAKKSDDIATHDALSKRYKEYEDAKKQVLKVYGSNKTVAATLGHFLDSQILRRGGQGQAKPAPTPASPQAAPSWGVSQPGTAQPLTAAPPPVPTAAGPGGVPAPKVPSMYDNWATADITAGTQARNLKQVQGQEEQLQTQLSTGELEARQKVSDAVKSFANGTMTFDDAMRTTRVYDSLAYPDPKNKGTEILSEMTLLDVSESLGKAPADIDKRRQDLKDKYEWVMRPRQEPLHYPTGVLAKAFADAGLPIKSLDQYTPKELADYAGWSKKERERLAAERKMHDTTLHANASLWQRFQATTKAFNDKFRADEIELATQERALATPMSPLTAEQKEAAITTITDLHEDIVGQYQNIEAAGQMIYGAPKTPSGQGTGQTGKAEGDKYLNSLGPR